MTVDFANKALSRFKAREDLSFVLREQHQVVGTCSVPRLAWEVPVFEIGYWLRASARGRGLMTEAVIGLRDYLVQYCNPLRLEIRCDSANAASRSVAVRTGFLEEATIRKSRRNNQGKLADETIYAWFPEEITEVNR
ncbi:MAG: GNAT family N-acetyltransferase [Bdellovibrionales bacterium]|nr:GNAT family N-acetyltransferase [Bdellovibrionales bacterium]